MISFYGYVYITDIRMRGNPHTDSTYSVDLHPSLTAGFYSLAAATADDDDDNAGDAAGTDVDADAGPSTDRKVPAAAAAPQRTRNSACLTPCPHFSLPGYTSNPASS